MQKYNLIASMLRQEQCKREVGTESTADLYRAVRNRLKRFTGKESLRLAEVTPALVSGFLDSLKKEGLQTNSVNSYVSCFRAMYNRFARESGYRTLTNPFAGLKLHREETHKRAVSSEVIKRVATADFSDNPELVWAAELALFGFLACGMPFVDRMHLTKRNLQAGNILSYKRKKNGALIEIPLGRKTIQLIEKYKSPDSPYLFPGLHAREMPGEYKALLRKFNKCLREISRRLQLDEVLTSYTFRHTWASEAHRQHVDISIISQALGHTNESTTRIYLTRLDPGEIGKANKRVTGEIEKWMDKRA